MRLNLLLPMKRLIITFQNKIGSQASLCFKPITDDLLTFEGLVSFFEKLEAEEINGLEQTIPLSSLPPQAAMGFFSEDQSTAVIPISFDSNLETKELKDRGRTNTKTS